MGYVEPVAGSELGGIRSDPFPAPRDFVAERDWQIVELGNAGAIMRVGVANPGRANTNQNFRQTDLRNFNLRILQRCSDLYESYSSHSSSAITAQTVCARD